MANQTIFTFQIHAAISTYVAGDEIKVVIDDTTNVVTVQKNGGTITSGDNLTASDFNDGKFSFASNNYKYCDGENLVVFDLPSFQGLNKDIITRWVPSFPYYRHRVIAEAGTCKGSSSDLIKWGTPLITPATSDTAGDASVKVSVRSSLTTKFYIQEFAFSQGGFSADTTESDGSGTIYTYTFANLKPGMRQLHATDSGGTSVAWDIDIGVDEKSNNYGLKYRAEFNDVPTKGTSFTRWRVDLYFKDYTDASAQITTLGSNPLKITFGKGKTGVSKFEDVINGTYFNLSLKSETFGQWINDFGFTQERRILAEVYRDDVLITHGYNLSDQYGEPIKDPPYDVSISFTDGLIDLKNHDYVVNRIIKDVKNPGETSIEGQTITGRSSAMEIIAFCLNKTGLNYNIISCLNTYATQMDSGNGDDPLTQEYFDNCAFYNDAGTPDNCYRVLEKIMKSYPIYARIMTSGNTAYILPVEATTSLDYRKFTNQGVYDSSGSLDPIINITPADGSGFCLTNNSYLQLDETYRTIQIVKARQVKESVFNEFNDTTVIKGGSGKANTFQGWSNVSNGDAVSWAAIKIGDDYALEFNGIDGQGADSYTVAKEVIQYQSSDKFELSFNAFFSPGKEISAASALPPWVPIRWMLKVGTKYYNQNGTWSSNETINEYFFSNHNDETNILYIDSFDTGIDQKEDIAEFRVYDADVKYHQVQANPNDASGDRINIIGSTFVAIADVDESSLTDGNRLITQTLWGDDGDYTNYYHTLRETNATQDASTLEVIAPDQDTNNQYRWMLDGSIAVNREQTLGSRFYLRKPKFKVLPGGAEIADEEVIEQGVDKGNLRIKEFELPFIEAPIELNNSLRSIKNVVFDASGDAIRDWGGTVDSIQMEILRRHYKRPLRRIQFSGFINTAIHPYNSIRDTGDSNRVYILDSLTLSAKFNTIDGELVEVTSDNPVDPTATTSGFDSGTR